MSDLSLDVTSSELEQIASRMAQLRSESENTAQKLANQVQTINDGWGGNASKVYSEKYTDLNNRLLYAVKNIEGIEKLLRNVADSIRTNEAQQIANARNDGEC